MKNIKQPPVLKSNLTAVFIRFNKQIEMKKTTQNILSNIFLGIENIYIIFSSPWTNQEGIHSPLIFLYIVKLWKYAQIPPPLSKPNPPLAGLSGSAHDLCHKI